MKPFRTAALAGLCALELASTAKANVITYQLNAILGNTLTPTASFGTVTYADNNSGAKQSVDVTVVLNGSGQKIQEFIFNYNDTKFSSTTPFVLTGNVASYSINEN